MHFKLILYIMSYMREWDSGLQHDPMVRCTISAFLIRIVTFLEGKN